MAKLGGGGDCTGVTEDDMNSGGGGWEAMPAGWYRFMVESSEYKPTNAGNGMCLHLSLRCLDQEHLSAEKRDFLTLEHPNADTTRIARAKLKQLAIAVDHPTPDLVGDSSDLHNKPVMVKLGVEKAKDPQYGDRNGMQNRVFAYKSIADYRAENAGSGKPSAPRQATAPAAPVDGDIPF